MEHIESIHLDDRIITLKIKDFSNSEIDLEELLQVDINNVVADLVTFPVIFNRISLIKAEIEDLESRTALELQILLAKKYNHYRLSLVYDEEIITSSGKSTGAMKKQRPSETTINSHIDSDEDVVKKRSELLNVKKQSKIIDGFYWSAKEKAKKLDTISAKIKPEDFEYEILEGEINSVMIKSREKLIK